MNSPESNPIKRVKSNAEIAAQVGRITSMLMVRAIALSPNKKLNDNSGYAAACNGDTVIMATETHLRDDTPSSIMSGKVYGTRKNVAIASDETGLDSRYEVTATYLHEPGETPSIASACITESEVKVDPHKTPARVSSMVSAGYAGAASTEPGTFNEPGGTTEVESSARDEETPPHIREVVIHASAITLSQIRGKIAAAEIAQHQRQQRMMGR